MTQARLTRGRSDPADVWHKSSRPTPGCFLSSGHWKVGIIPAKGKAPKVPAALKRGELVPHIPEGRWGEHPT